MKAKKLTLLILLSLGSCTGDILDDYSTSEIPEYFKEELNVCKSHINAALKEPDSKSSFVFLTDTHWEDNERYSSAIVRSIIEGTPIDKCIFGGDAIRSCYVDRNEAIFWGNKFASSFSFLGENFIAVYGNHDNNSNGQIESEEVLPYDDVYNFLQIGMQSNSLVYGDCFYFYKDVDKEKTRYIGLDTGLHRISEGEWLFLIDALKECKEGWHIIIATHILQEGGKMPSYIKNLANVLDMYNARRSGSVYGSSIDYDFTEAKAKVEFCVGGHVHYDSELKSDGGIPILSFDCDARNTEGQIPFRKGTVDEQCVTAIVADYEKDSIYCYRVGRGDDIYVKIGK